MFLARTPSFASNVSGASQAYRNLCFTRRRTNNAIEFLVAAFLVPSPLTSLPRSRYLPASKDPARAAIQRHPPVSASFKLLGQLASLSLPSLPSPSADLPAAGHSPPLDEQIEPRRPSKLTDVDTVPTWAARAPTSAGASAAPASGPISAPRACPRARPGQSPLWSLEEAHG